MGKIYKAVEWQSATGKWHCNDPDLITRGDQWLISAKILNMNITDFLVMMQNEYKANLHIKEDGTFAYCTWDNQVDMRKYKNWINAKARSCGLLF